MALKSASTTTTKLDLGDGDFVEVKTDISKRDYKSLAAFFPDRAVGPEDRLTPSEGVELQTGLFRALVVGWSADMEPTAENYEGLEAPAALRIDEALANHFKTLVPTVEEGKTDTTSRGSKRRG